MFHVRENQMVVFLAQPLWVPLDTQLHVRRVFASPLQ
jgi:hypothetical protein